MQCSAVVIFKHSTTVETGALQIMQLVLVTWFWTCDDLLMFWFPWSQAHVWGLGNAAFLAPGRERHRNWKSEAAKESEFMTTAARLDLGSGKPTSGSTLAQNFFLPEDSRAPSTGDSCPGHARRERAAFQLKACVLDTYGRSKGDPCLNMEWSLTKIPSAHGLARGEGTEEGWNLAYVCVSWNLNIISWEVMTSVKVSLSNDFREWVHENKFMKVSK